MYIYCNNNKNNNNNNHNNNDNNNITGLDYDYSPFADAVFFQSTSLGKKITKNGDTHLPTSIMG